MCKLRRQQITIINYLFVILVSLKYVTNLLVCGGGSPDTLFLEWKMLHLQQNLYNICTTYPNDVVWANSLPNLFTPWDPQYLTETDKPTFLSSLYLHAARTHTFLSLSPFSLSLFSLLHKLTQKLRPRLGR